MANVAPHGRRPRPATPTTTDPLAEALRRALAAETDPAVRQWIERLLRGDAAKK